MLAVSALLLLLPSVGRAAEDAAAAPVKQIDYSAAIGRLREIVESELKRGLLGGVAISLVDDQRLVFAGGFGYADKRRKVPATGSSVYRAGSVSKLFTAIAAMQLVEQGKLDIDKPVSTYDPDFGIVVPFADAEPITLRQLMCHRSGMVRESPAGGYFDPREPTIDETVASIAPCVLVHEPNTKTKYSNVGPTISGRVVSLVAGLPYEEYQQQYVLGPLGMKNSSFVMTDALAELYAPGFMRVADGQGGFNEIKAPRFELGTLPAGNLYTTAEDLARFLMFLLANGRAGEKQLLRAETLQQMLTVQLTDQEAGFGLGFHVGEFGGHKMVSHTGAVYGHSTSVAALSEKKIGVVVLANEDITMGPVRKLAREAMELMIDAKLGEAPQPKEEAIEVAAADLAAYEGDYESQSHWGRLEVRDGVLHANLSGQRLELTPTGADKFLADGRFADRAVVEFQRNDTGQVTGFTALDQRFLRVDPATVREIPRGWRKFLGSYGYDFMPLVISVRHGHLYAMTENMVDYRLTPLNRTVFRMCPGMYVDEQLVFESGPDGRVHGVILANMSLKRRP